MGLVLHLTTHAQMEDKLNDVFYSSGKIKVVIAVVAVIMLGLLLYMFRLDRKLSKLEKTLGNKK